MTLALLAALLAAPAARAGEIPPPGEPSNAWASRPNSLRLNLGVFYAGLIGVRYDRALGPWSLGGVVATWPSSLHAHARLRPVTLGGAFAPTLELSLGGGAFMLQREGGADPFVLDGAGLVGVELRRFTGLSLDLAAGGGPVYLPRSQSFDPFVFTLRLGIGGAW